MRAFWPRFLWAANPFQGLAESLLVGAMILIAVAHLEGYAEWYVFQAGLFFLCGVCGMWAALRIRMPRGGWLSQTLWELAVGLGLSLLMLYGLRRLGNFFNWDALWRVSTWPRDSVALLFACTGPGYFLARGGLRFWRRWDRMRRQRMVWALTHTQLTVVAFFAFLVALSIYLRDPYAGGASRVWAQTQDPVRSLLTGLLVTLFPAVILISVLTIVVLAVLLPPLAIISFFVAQRTTRRLEALAQTTAALRAGDYQARVAVDGEDEVGRLQSDFNAMAEKLAASLADLKSERDTVAEVLQDRRDLVASVSHELRTPVATLRAALETTLQLWPEAAPGSGPDEPSTIPVEPVRQKLGLMESEIQRLSGLIDDLFTLSQVEVKNLRLECVPIALVPLVRQVVDTFAPLAWQTGRVEVVADLPDGLPPAHADAQRLQQVLLNLLRNAARHTLPGGIVAVSAAIEDERLRIDVRDTGQGIDPDDLPHIWERFYRGKNHAPESAGLGLALVKELVEAMGGAVAVESTLGQGSCFSVWLPRS